MLSSFALVVVVRTVKQKTTMRRRVGAKWHGMDGFEREILLRDPIKVSVFAAFRHSEGTQARARPEVAHTLSIRLVTLWKSEDRAQNLSFLKK